MRSGGAAVLPMPPESRAGGPRRASARPPGARSWSPPAWLAAAGLYLVASLALHHRVLGDLTGRATGWASSDSSLFAWWLHWTPWAVLDGQNPLYTTWLVAPGGTNAMWNTAVPLLAALLAPITLTAGPVAAFNVGMILGPVASGLACYLALRPYAAAPARTLAGGLYAFGPFVIAHTSVGHLNLAWGLLPPILLWAVRAILVEARRPWRDGALLGLALAVQTGLYTQTIALGAIATAVTALVLAVRWPGEVRARLGAVARATAAAIGVWAVMCAYPLWLVLAGPARPRGLIRDPATTGADAAGLVVPTALTKLQTGMGGVAARLTEAAGEQGSYLGMTMLALMIAAAITVRSSALRVAVAVAGLLALLSLGPTLRILGHDTGVPLPWRLVHAVPLLDQSEGARLGAFVACAVAVVVAIAAQRALDDRRWWLLAAVLLAAVTWMPSNSQQVTPAAVPEFFAAGAPGLTRDDVVTTWPRTTGTWVGGADPMRWQSASGMAYRQIDAYAIGGDATDPVLHEGRPATYHLGYSANSAGEARADLQRRGVTAVVYVPGAQPVRAGSPPEDSAAVLAWTRQVTGDPGRFVGGVWLFRLP